MRTLRWFHFDPERGLMSLDNMELVDKNEDDSPATDDEEYLA
jgi:hypothetical protein